MNSPAIAYGSLDFAANLLEELPRVSSNSVRSDPVGAPRQSGHANADRGRRLRGPGAD